MELSKNEKIKIINDINQLGKLVKEKPLPEAKKLIIGFKSDVVGVLTNFTSERTISLFEVTIDSAIEDHEYRVKNAGDESIYEQDYQREPLLFCCDIMRNEIRKIETEKN